MGYPKQLDEQGYLEAVWGHSTIKELQDIIDRTFMPRSNEFRAWAKVRIKELQAMKLIDPSGDY